MKILHVIDSLGIGGTENLLKDTLPLLNDYEHVLCYLENPDTLLPQMEVKSSYFLEYRSKWSLLKSIFRLRKIIRHEKPDVIHTHLYKSTLITRLASWGYNPKIISTIHGQLGLSLFSLSKFDLWLERFTVSAKHHLIGVSKVALDDYKRFIPFKGKSDVIYNFVRKEFFNRMPLVDLNNFNTLKIVVVGNLKPVKNHIYLLHALSKIKSLPIIVDIYGEGDERKNLQAEIDQQMLPVYLKGAIYNIEEILPNYHCFILCSHHEGYGIAPMEAMAVGIPILVSDIPVFREVFGDNALYFNLNDHNGLSQLLTDIIDNKINLSKLSDQVKKYAQKTVSEKHYTISLKRIYNDL